MLFLYFPFCLFISLSLCLSCVCVQFNASILRNCVCENEWHSQLCNNAATNEHPIDQFWNDLFTLVRFLFACESVCCKRNIMYSRISDDFVNDKRKQNCPAVFVCSSVRCTFSYCFMSPQVTLSWREPIHDNTLINRTYKCMHVCVCARALEIPQSITWRNVDWIVATFASIFIYKYFVLCSRFSRVTYIFAAYMKYPK